MLNASTPIVTRRPLLYLGGNGFYRRVSVSDRVPGQNEVRRTEDGTRAWIAERARVPTMDGAMGGLEATWAPRRTGGRIGFAAQGSTKLVLQGNPDARSGPAAFALDGVATRSDATAGSATAGGLKLTGSTPSCARSRGSPIASSFGPIPVMLRTKEECLSTVLPLPIPKRGRTSRSGCRPIWRGLFRGSMTWSGRCSMVETDCRIDVVDDGEWH